jgi:hypothetical protein
MANTVDVRHSENFVGDRGYLDVGQYEDAAKN